jgi:hypothetical protein
MFKKYVALLLMTLVFNLSSPVFVSAQKAPDEKAQKRAAKIKAEIAKIGTGPTARVNIKLTNGSKISGYVSKINDSSFVIVSDQSGAATEVEYTDATTFSRYRKRLSPVAQAAIAIGAAFGIFLLICAASGKCQE